MTGAERDHWLASALLAWFPVLVCLVSVPLQIYLPNQAHYGFDPGVLWPLLVAAGVALAVFCLLFRVVGHRLRRLPLGLFLVGVFILVTDIVAPMDWGVLDGEAALAEPLGLTLIELAVAAGLILAAVFLPRAPARRAGAAISAVFALSQAVTLATGLEPPPEGSTGEAAVPQAAPSALPNVYHVVFDAYSSLVFEASLDRTGLRDGMAGFTFYRDNLANYVATAGSAPSYLTGTFYEGGDFAAWQEAARTGGIRRTLQDAGYELSLYVPDRSRYWAYPGAGMVRTSREISRGFFASAAAFQLAQVSLVRVTPNPLRRETLDGTEALFGWIVASLNGVDDLGGISGVEFYKRFSVPLVEQFLAEEAARPATGQYVYIHVILPHAPFTWSADCEYSDGSDFTAQTDCATRLMGRMIARLAELGRLEGSLVLFQSDHGYHGPGAGEQPAAFRPSAEVAARAAGANRFFPAEGLMTRFHALLAVKPPGASGPFEVSPAPTQLADVPATIAHLLGLPVPEGPGRPVTTLDPARPRPVPGFLGIYTRDDDGRSVILGRDHPSADLLKLVFERPGGWRIEGD